MKGSEMLTRQLPARAVGVGGEVTVTGAPTCSLYCPSVTMRSPPLNPEATTVVMARCQGEHDGGRLREHQRRQRALVVRVDDIAGVDETHAHAAVARRGNGGVFELRLRGRDHRVVSGDCGLELIDLGRLLVD